MHPKGKANVHAKDDKDKEGVLKGERPSMEEAEEVTHGLGLGVKVGRGKGGHTFRVNG